jgi:hypothetical protein
MLIFGAIHALGAFGGLSEWSSMSRALDACLVLLFVGGIGMFVSGAWLLVRFGRAHRPLMLGGFAAALCGFVVIAGVLAKVIPCAGPT